MQSESQKKVSKLQMLINTAEQAEALYEFIPTKGENQLSLKPGDILAVLSKPVGGWWYGEKDGQRGHFPKDYVKLVVKSKELESITVPKKEEDQVKSIQSEVKKEDIKVESALKPEELKKEVKEVAQVNETPLEIKPESVVEHKEVQQAVENEKEAHSVPAVLAPLVDSVQVQELVHSSVNDVELSLRKQLSELQVHK